MGKLFTRNKQQPRRILYTNTTELPNVATDFDNHSQEVSVTEINAAPLPALGGHGEILFRIFPDIFRVTYTQECTANYGAKNDRGPESYLNRPRTSLSTSYFRQITALVGPQDQ